MKKNKSYSRKHASIINDYDKQKSKHLDKLATQMLKNDEKSANLKSRPIKGDFLKNF
jgi:hypothetical protein|tara:strand:+ start:2436 stop:2606 length:171 start_codon:yes stop_codon:yes gene_type:complete